MSESGLPQAAMANALAMANPDKCGKRIGEHVCLLVHEANDDPEVVHICYSDDCDFTEGEFVELRLSRMDERTLMILGRARAFYRRGFITVDSFGIHGDLKLGGVASEIPGARQRFIEWVGKQRV